MIMIVESNITCGLAEKCQLCSQDPGDRPWEDYEFSDYLQGEWRRDSERVGKETVTINGNTMTFPSRGTFRSLRRSVCSLGKDVRIMTKDL